MSHISRHTIFLRPRVRRGLTLTEILVTIAILGILMALLLPAVQAAREAARNATCKNHLRQVGLAIQTHEAAHGHFPSGGWGFQWVGDPDRGTGPGQPGGWLFALLPYLEATAVHELAHGAGPDKRTALGAMLQQPIAVLVCPSRRGSELRPFLGLYPLHNAEKPPLAFKNDYAGNGGDVPQDNLGGPASETPQAVAAYPWPKPGAATGIFFARSQIRIANVSDGLSHTYLAGEKNVRRREAQDAETRDYGDDQSALMGDDRDVRRWTHQPPRRDHADLDSPDTFGSRHPAHWNALLGDGSVHSLSYEIDADLHRALGNRQDGAPVGNL